MFCSFPIDTATCLENQRLKTRHVGAAKRAFRARRPPILTHSTRDQTGWNVTKCHACHAKLAWKPSERRGFAASPINTATCLENQRLETRNVGAAKRAFRARRPPILTHSTRDQTGWNVTKCHACHAKLAWKPSKRRGFAASPINTATCLENQRLETRNVGAAKRSFRARLLPILTLSAHDQTGWNVTKCHACHAKRHDNLLGNLPKGEVLQLPP